MPTHRDLIASAASALHDRIEEVNRLNVFPVPDGDTGTNMSLTMGSVVEAVGQLPADASVAQVCRAVTRGSLMGARGNSGVILSQILRGLCEGVGEEEEASTHLLVDALERAAVVAYQAVRKPVEGTMLTVIKDTAAAARTAADGNVVLADALERVAAGAFDSVRRTPELLPVLKENGVVDAGGFGLALLIEGFVAAALGHKVVVADVSSAAAPLEMVVPVDDWDDDEYLYCTEFLLFGEAIDREAVHDFVASVGGSELVVGEGGSFKVHVHTNDPGVVLSHVAALGEVAEVHVNNMRRQQVVRDSGLRAERETAATKPVGFVAVAAGEGLARILESLGVDVVVSGGQTMNPSTQDLVDAIGRVNAERIVVLPNNKNILMAAGAAASVVGEHVAVVPTRSVPQAFSALLAYNDQDELSQIVTSMTAAAGMVRTGEVTTAVKDAKGKTGDILAGQVIGIIDDEEIEVVGADVAQVAMDLAHIFAQEGAETITLLAGADMSDDALAAVSARMQQDMPDVAIETHRGEQPLYPIILSAE